MAGKDRYLQERNGRFYARLVVPEALRPHLDNKTELRAPLGADRRAAVKALAGAVVEIQKKLDVAERACAGSTRQVPLKFPINNDQIAVASYFHRLEQDKLHRTKHPLYAGGPIDDGSVVELRLGASGQADDNQLEDLVGHRISEFRRRGNTDVLFGSEDWRDLATKLCISELEALQRVVERDGGKYSGQLQDPDLIRASEQTSVMVVGPEPVSLLRLFDDYVTAKRAVGKGAGAERRWATVFKHLRKFLGHDDARRMTKQDLMSWRNELMKTLAAKTVSDVYLASVRTVLNWALREDRLTENVAVNVRQELPKRKATREEGFTDAEASVILAAAWSYVHPAKELESTAAAKKWVPWLCAFTGARVTELTQLRKQDLRREGELWVIRITPDAGTVKTGVYHDVPLHSQLEELGFTGFVEASPSGPLFHRNSSPSGALSAAKTVSGRISTWLGTLQIIPKGVSPSHGWRHRFKTVGRELQLSDRVLDAICGHVGKTAGDNYGDVTITAKARVIGSFPNYLLGVNRRELQLHVNANS